MKTKTSPPLMMPRSRQLAMGLVAGLTVLSTSAVASPSDAGKKAPAEKVADKDDDKAAEETPEQEIARLEGEVAALESEIETAESCAAEAAKSKAGAGTCPDPTAAKEKLSRSKARLTRVRSQEKDKKRHPARVR